MVFAINAGASGSNNSFEAFLQRARATANATNSTTYGNGSTTTNGTTTNGTGTPTTSVTGSSSTSKPNGDISLFASVPGSVILSGLISFGVSALLV